VEPILAGLRLAGCVIGELDIAQPDLEDVFVQLTGSGAASADTANVVPLLNGSRQ
jgi:hypothetical protein